MARIDPLPREELADFEPGFAMVEQMMGFVPNSMFTMPRVPGLLPAFQAMGAALMTGNVISRELTQMVAQIASTVAGCRYCQAHTAHTAERAGVSFFGFLNRWNDTMATDLEEHPMAFGQRVLAEGGWEAGKHAG